MRVVAQVVRDAQVSINEQVHSQISYGLLLLVSFTDGDNTETVRKMADKVMKMRIFPDREGKTNLAVSDVNGALMSISQFTLYGVFEGRRPSFTKVLNGHDSSALYDIFNTFLSAEIKTETGVFGADMDVRFTNVGPSTYILESDER